MDRKYIFCNITERQRKQLQVLSFLMDTDSGTLILKFIEKGITEASAEHLPSLLKTFDNAKEIFEKVKFEEERAQKISALARLKKSIMKTRNADDEIKAPVEEERNVEVCISSDDEPEESESELRVADFYDEKEVEEPSAFCEDYEEYAKETVTNEEPEETIVNKDEISWRVTHLRYSLPRSFPFVCEAVPEQVFDNMEKSGIITNQDLLAAPFNFLRRIFLLWYDEREGVQVALVSVFRDFLRIDFKTRFSKEYEDKTWEQSWSALGCEPYTYERYRLDTIEKLESGEDVPLPYYLKNTDRDNRYESIGADVIAKLAEYNVTTFYQLKSFYESTKGQLVFNRINRRLAKTIYSVLFHFGADVRPGLNYETKAEQPAPSSVEKTPEEKDRKITADIWLKTPLSVTFADNADPTLKFALRNLALSDVLTNGDYCSYTNTELSKVFPLQRSFSASNEPIEILANRLQRLLGEDYKKRLGVKKNYTFRPDFSKKIKAYTYGHYVVDTAIKLRNGEDVELPCYFPSTSYAALLNSQSVKGLRENGISTFGQLRNAFENNPNPPQIKGIGNSSEKAIKNILVMYYKMPLNMLETI